MGLKADWLVDVENVLKGENIQVENVNHSRYHLLCIPKGKLILNLVSLSQSFDADEFIFLQETYRQENIHVIHLWEDIFLTRRSQVLGRIKSFVGLNKRIHGRSTIVEKISKEDTQAFMEKFHLQGNVNSRYRYCLTFKNEVVAVATFSNKRKMSRRGADYCSAELIRFATKDGFTVTGGLSKLIKHYLKILAPNDLMSYADRDWSLGKAYLAAGFKLKAITPASPLYIDPKTLQRYFFHRLPIKNELSLAAGGDQDQYVKIFNTGNLKFILEC